MPPQPISAMPGRSFGLVDRRRSLPGRRQLALDEPGGQPGRRGYRGAVIEEGAAGDMDPLGHSGIE